MTTRADIIREARDWVGVPYLDQHKTKAGCDCIGLILGVAGVLGVPPHYPAPAYTPNPDGVMMRREMQRMFDPVYDTLKPGMIGCFWYAHREYPQHLCIFSDYRGLGMIHTNQANASVREHRIDEHWGKRFIAPAFDFPGVTE